MMKLLKAASASLCLMMAAGAANACSAPSPADEAMILSGTNDVRSRNGLPKVSVDQRLSKAALDHACDMARNGYFSHQRKNGPSLGQRVSSAGYKYCLAAENIALGQRDGSHAMKSWIESKGHLENLLNPRITQIGIARVPAPNRSGHYLVQVMAAPC